MPVFAVPDGDTATGLGWTTSGFARLDEGAPGDDVVAGQSSNNASEFLDKSLTDETDPAVSTGHILRIRWRSPSGNRTLNGFFELWQGTPGSGTLIATLNINDLPSTLQIDTVGLTGTETDNITDYTAIQGRVYYTYTGGGSASSFEVDFFELEIPSGGTAHTATPTEAVGITDSTPVEQQKVRAEPIGITDDTTRVHDADRTVAEPVGITDSTPVEQGKDLAEAVGITDEIEAELQIQAEVTEAVGITDTTEPVVGKERTVTEAVGVTDSLDLIQGKDRAEPVGITDTTLPAKTIRVEITEAIGITDQIDSEKLLTAEITEAVGITDDTNTARDLAREVSEPVGITDVTATARDLARTIAEAVGLTDTTAAARDLARTIAEAVGLTDLIISARDLVRQIIEDLGLTDTTLPVLTPGGGGTIHTVEITEAIGITDQVGASPWWAPDPVGISPATVGIDRRTPGKSSPGI